MCQVFLHKFIQTLISFTGGKYMGTSGENLSLHYNVKLNYNDNGKELYQIIKEHFLIYIKQLKKDKQNNEKVNQE